MTTNAARFSPLLTRIAPGARLVSARVLAGGMSATVTALEFERADGLCGKVVVREHGEADRAQNPNIAADEFKLLSALHIAGVRVPRPVYHGDGISHVPCLVIEFVEGSTQLPQDRMYATHLLAQHLAAVHRVDWVSVGLSFLPQQDALMKKHLREIPTNPDESLSESRIRAALAEVWPLPVRNAACLLHGDYWPYNILWKGDELAAIIDWEDAALGDPLFDLANTRMEVLWALGEDAMRVFTTGYLHAMPHLHAHDLPAWDLLAALRPCGKLDAWDLPPDQEKQMRDQHACFVSRALRLLFSDKV